MSFPRSGSVVPNADGWDHHSMRRVALVGVLTCIAFAMSGCAGEASTSGFRDTGSDRNVSHSGSWSDGSSRLELHPDGTVHGDSGCNIVFGEWRSAPGGILFEPIGATQVGCPGLDWEQLPTAARITDDGLTLLAGDSSEIAHLDPDPAGQTVPVLQSRS